MHRAGAALRQPAAEMRIVQAEIVAQRVEQRHVGIDIDLVLLAVDVQGELLGHAASLARTDVLRHILPLRETIIG